MPREKNGAKLVTGEMGGGGITGNVRSQGPYLLMDPVKPPHLNISMKLYSRENVLE